MHACVVERVDVGTVRFFELAFFSLCLLEWWVGELYVSTRGGYYLFIALWSSFGVIMVRRGNVEGI